MPDLSGITGINIIGGMRGAYKDPVFELEGVDDLVSLEEIIEWLSDNSGGSGGGTTIYGEYESDAAASSGGVLLNRYYTLSNTNIYGLPHGTVKKRVS